MSLALLFAPSTAPPAVPEFVLSLGTQIATSSGTTTQLTYLGGTSIDAGDTILVVCARDTLATTDGVTDTMTDSHGNTFTQVKNVVAGLTGAVGGGVVLVLFKSVVTIPWMGGPVSITWTHGAVVARAFLAQHWRGVGSMRSGTDAAATATDGVISVATGATNPVSGDLVYGAVAFEYGNTGPPSSEDTDTTNGSWSAGATIGNGVFNPTGVKAFSQYKLTTASGAQTFGPIDNGAATDAAGLVVAFGPAGPAGPARLQAIGPGVLSVIGTGPLYVRQEGVFVPVPGA